MAGQEEYRKAQRHLARRDPVLRQLIAAIGPCTLRHDPDRFATLVRSIISQQISTKAARSIQARLEEALAPGGITPKKILAVSVEKLRSAGLSASKALSVRDLADKIRRRQVPLHDMHDFTDAEVIEQLLPVRGIGRWTAEMFLIFSLGRLDVLPIHDLGLRAGVQRRYDLKELPDKARLHALAEPWRPYRTIATWYFWRSQGNVPQSGSGRPAAKTRIERSCDKVTR